ncbi:MAG: elongation factor P [Planctomycetota bacterium]|nr:elongation factor P [Planctomycetota bacterium]
MDYTTSDFRKGIRIELDSEPYVVTESEFMKPGKGQAVYRIKCKNLLRGNVIDRTYRSGDKVKAADVEEYSLQYLYNDSSLWHFMHPESFEQYEISKENLGEGWKWLIDEAMVEVVFWNGKPIIVKPPNHVELKVEYCEPGARGNTATNVQKPAKVETGVEVHVPAFINIDDIIKVDTRTGEYVERVKKA